GPVIVTVLAFLSMAVIGAVTVTSRPTAPAGVSPGFELTRDSCVVEPAAAVPAGLIWNATASMYLATTGSPTVIASGLWGSFTSSVTVRPLGPLSVTV